MNGKSSLEMCKKSGYKEPEHLKHHLWAGCLDQCSIAANKSFTEYTFHLFTNKSPPQCFLCYCFSSQPLSLSFSGVKAKDFVAFVTFTCKLCTE